jgi:membrane protease YdiL (CAAX protease family)
MILVLFNGFVEEVFWRGYCMGRLKGAVGSITAILVTAVFYASYHIVTLFSFFGVSVLSISLVLVVFSGGLLWGRMRNYFGNLWAPAIGHMLATAGYMTIFVMV